MTRYPAEIQAERKTIMNDEKLYMEYLEQLGRTTDSVIAARDALTDVLEDYIEAVQEWTFSALLILYGIGTGSRYKKSQKLQP